MGCLFFILGLITPRVAIFLLWLLSNWFSGVYDNIIIPILGFIFLPYTFLWYSVVINVFDGAWGFWQIIIMALAVLFDFSAYGGSARYR
jgi:hypothetical protein